MSIVKANFYKFQVGKIYTYNTRQGDAIYVLDVDLNRYNPKYNRITFIDTKDYFGYYGDNGAKYSTIYTTSLTTEYLGDDVFRETIPNHSVYGTEELSAKVNPTIYKCARQVKAKLLKKK